MAKIQSIKLVEDNIEKKIINCDMNDDGDGVSNNDNTSVIMINGLGAVARLDVDVDQSRDGDGDDSNAKSEPKKEGFDSYLEFMLSAVSYAVGLGNIWRFPYLVYRNGGGTFLIPYSVMLIFVGIPLYGMESSLGQYMQASPVNVWQLAPLFTGLGYAMAFMSALVAIYYNMIIAWSLRYWITSVFQTIYWNTCDNSWNTPSCMKNSVHECAHINGTMLFNATCLVRQCLWHNHTNIVQLNLNPSLPNIENENITCDIHDQQWLGFVDQNSRRPTEEYFHREVLGMSESINNLGGLRADLVACYFICWVLVIVCLIKGLKSMGKFSWFTALFPYFVLIAFLGRCIMLDGAWQGIKFFLHVDFNRLWAISVWADAAMQIFFSLSPCWGGIITLARANSRQHDFIRDAWIISMINCMTSVLAAFVTFSIVGFMAAELGKEVGEVVQGGCGLAFITYTDAVSRMPLSKLWAAIFFFMLLTLGFGTQFTLVQSVVATIAEELFPRTTSMQKRLVLIVTCSVLCTAGLVLCTNAGMYYLQLMDNFCASFSAIIIGLVEVFVIMHVYGYKKFVKQSEQMLGKKLIAAYWVSCWLFITPAILAILLVMAFIQYEPPSYADHVFPEWSAKFGWFLSFSSVSMIPIVALYKLAALTHGTLWERICFLCRPSPAWNPPQLENGDDNDGQGGDDDSDDEQHRRGKRSEGGGNLARFTHLLGLPTGGPHHSESQVALKNNDSDSNVSDNDSNILNFINSPEEHGFAFSNRDNRGRYGLTSNSSSNSLDSDTGINMTILKRS